MENAYCATTQRTRGRKDETGGREEEGGREERRRGGRGSRNTTLFNYSPRNCRKNTHSRTFKNTKGGEGELLITGQG